MNYQELSNLSNDLYDRFKSGDKQQMFNVLATITHNPKYSIRNALVMHEQYGKPVRKIVAYKTETDKKEWECSGRRILKGAKQINYWIPEKYKDEQGKEKTRFLMSWGYEIRDTTDELRPPGLDLKAIAEYLCNKYDIKTSSGLCGKPCIKIDKNHIMYDQNMPVKEKRQEAIGQILRCICPSSKPLIIGAMVVYKYTGNIKLLAREVGRNDIPLKPEEVKDIKNKYSILIHDLNLLEKNIEKEKLRNQELNRNKEEAPVIKTIDDGPIEI